MPVTRSSLGHRTGRIARILGTIAIAAVIASWWASRPAVPDAFYELALPKPAEPGALLRQEPFSRAIPAGARAWRILYSTTRADNSAAIASAIVLTSAKTTGSTRPIIAWAHGTTGIVPGCGPSVSANPFANVPAVDQVVREDWAFVATDYVGLGTRGGHAYLVGEDAARALLDAARAARRLPGTGLDDRVVVWGHSQGGNSALWAAGRARDYAPDLKLFGVAAQAPATDLKALVASAQSSTFGKIVSAFLIKAYGAAYPDVAEADYVNWWSRILAGDIASRCVGGWPTIFSILEARLLPRGGIFATDPAAGSLGRRLTQNTPLSPIPVPVFIAQGEIDDLVLPDVQGRYVARRCAQGQPIDYRVYRALDHVSLVGAASPLAADLVAWTRDRLEGRPATDNCKR
jgi:acetyl esterase/lipase